MYSETLFNILSVLTLGIPYILIKWWPALKCRLLMNPCSFADAECVLAINCFNQIEILYVYNAENSSFGQVLLYSGKYRKT